jgi:phage shock protein E
MMKTRIWISVFLVFSALSTVYGQQVKQITSKEALQMMEKNKKIIVLDVRTPAEYSLGHIKGAVNIDVKQPGAFDNIDKLNRNVIYIVHCRTNHRSKLAVDHMSEKGFRHIYQLSDGFTGWSQNGLPVIQEKAN